MDLHRELRNARSLAYSTLAAHIMASTHDKHDYAYVAADTAPFALTFWDDSLEPRPANAPDGVERRCEVMFEGDHTETA